MTEKRTDELEKILQSTHPDNITSYLCDNSESMILDENSFSQYMRKLIKEKKILQQEVFLNADVPERYGYKLLSGEKRTKQRDVILRLCYGANFTLEETQEALKLYEMPVLYAKIPRDALLMVCFNEHPGSIIDVNSYLKKNGMEVLRSSGVQE